MTNILDLKNKKSLGKLLDPFALLGIISLFLVAILTVLNLSPVYKPQYPTKNVLGITETNTVQLEPNYLKKNGITLTKMTQNNDSSYTLYISMDIQTKGNYKNKLFLAQNGTESEKSLKISLGEGNIPTNTKIAVSIDNTDFILLDEDNKSYPSSIYIQPDESIAPSIKIETEADTNYLMEFNIEVSVE